MPNIDLTCVECHSSFYFSEKDQAFYAERGFQQPKRCYTCRQKRKNNGSQAPQQPEAPKLPPVPGRRRRGDDDGNY